jgi:diaminopimelate decarboxylase
VFTRFLGTQRKCEEGFEIGGVLAEELASRYGTPLYVFDVADFRAKTKLFRESAGESNVSYASKANGAIGILRLALEEGLHVDVASLGELEAALIAGYPPSKITVHGNNKSHEELARAAGLRVSRIVLDNQEEIDKLAPMTPPADVMVRVAPGVDPETHLAIKTGHEDTKFGFSFGSGSALAAVREVLRLKQLRLVGLHCHVGSQLLDSDAHVASAHRLAELARMCDAEIPEVCMGGGLGIRYTAADMPISISEHVQVTRQAVESSFRSAGIDVPRVSFEPGRALVGEAGLTLYRVGSTKKVGLSNGMSRNYAVVDGGMADNPRPQLYAAKYTAMNASRLGQPHDTPFRISGRHCETDTLIDNSLLPAATNAGDLIAVQCTGAYNYAMSSNYNRYPRPAMVLVEEGRAIQIVRREKVEDLFACELLPQSVGGQS